MHSKWIFQVDKLSYQPFN